MSNTWSDPYSTPSGYYNAYYGNPWWTINNSRQKDNRDNVISNVKVEVKPLSWLTASYTVNYNAIFDQFQYHRNSIHYESWGKFYADNGFDIYPASGGYKTSNYPGISQEGYRESSTSSRLQGDLLISAHKTFKKFSVNVIAGHSMYEIRTSVKDVGLDPTTGAVNTYDDLNVWGPTFAIGTPLSGESETTRRAIGIFGDATLGYNNWLFLHGSLRNDWDSRLEQHNRRFLYPSVDLSFIFTDAIPGMKNFTALTTGKLRLSYAKVGQINVAPYATRDVYVTPSSLGFPYTNSSGAISSYAVGGTFNNPNIKPE
jgi:hypothetical protein